MQAMSGQLDGPHMWTVENRKAPWLLLAPRIPSLCHNSSMAKKMWSPGSRGLPLTENNLGVCAYQAYQFSTEILGARSLDRIKSGVKSGHGGVVEPYHSSFNTHQVTT